jgi:hypothetical protein
VLSDEEARRALRASVLQTAHRPLAPASASSNAYGSRPRRRPEASPWNGHSTASMRNRWSPQGGRSR